jgi:hypothetical protein
MKIIYINSLAFQLFLSLNFIKLNIETHIRLKMGLKKNETLLNRNEVRINFKRFVKFFDRLFHWKITQK